MNTIKWLVTAIISFSLILCTGCKKQGTEWKGTIETEDGTIIIRNPKEPVHKEPVFELVEDLVIKGSEKIEEQMFQSIHTLDVDAEGYMHILDEQAGNIKVFDQNGSFVKTIGRKGQGPGEFGMPISLFLSRQNQIIVNDMGQRKVQYFDMKGNYLKEFSIADKFLFFGPMVTSSGDLIVSYTIPQEKPVTVLQKLDPEFQSILTFTSLSMDTPPVLNIFVARSLSSLRWSMTENEEIIWADIKNSEYELRFHDADGKLKRIITREYDPISITSDDKDRLMEETFGNNPTDQWDIRFPDHYPPFSGFSFDDLGHLFVKRYEKETHEKGGLYDIFDAEGKYIAQTRLKMNPMIWKKGHMYTIEDDEEELKVVKRYKVNWII
ncbi:MAG: 6-bladed beta-propeller [Candidatus Aminicenantes bacterium]|nr:MAG: 6-bladed beta-propeller [Candidatus Aminicenantes bacterium]